MAGFAGLVEGFRKRSGEKSFLDRLDDLRGRLIRSLLLVTVGTAVGFYVSMTYDVLGVFVAPIEPYLGGGRLKYLSPTDPFFVTLRLAICIGIAVTLPYLLHQLWALVSPLMLPDEKRFLAPTIVAGTGLFAAGVVFCYFLVLPLMLQFTLGFQTESLEQSIVIGEYLKIVLRLLAAFGVAFELPIIILFGTVLGVVTPDFLASNRREAIAIAAIVSAIVTPPDLSSQVLLLIPVLILYEASIVISRIVVARRADAVTAAEGT